MLFSTCCVTARAGLAAGVWFLRSHLFVHVLTLLAGAFAAVFLLMRLVCDGRVWWFREIHFVSGVLLAVSSILAIVLIDDSLVVMFPAIIIATDTAVGVMTAFIIRPFKTPNTDMDTTEKLLF